MFRKFGWRCLKVLPTVYDESLSYYEQVCKLGERVTRLENEGAVYCHHILLTSGDNFVRFVVYYGSEEFKNVSEVVGVLKEQGLETAGVMCSGVCSSELLVAIKVSVSNLVAEYMNGDSVNVSSYTMTDVVV